MVAHKSGNAPVDDDKKDKNTSENDPKETLSKFFAEEELLTGPESHLELTSQIDTLNKALKEAQEKAESHWERLLRKEAEMKNLERRHEQEISSARKFAIERFAEALLPVLDSFDQGIAFSQSGQGSLQDLLKGMELTKDVLLGVLDKHGITLIDPQNEMFNPNFHEAISIQETAEVEPNRIVAVVQKGYVLNDRLLRPARVVVAKAPAK